MIEISNLSKTYRSSGKKAVDNLTLTAKSGEIYGFLGPNGAGKSTTIKCLTGILGYEEGTIKIDGVDLKENPVLAKSKIGYIADEHFLYEGLTGRQYINFVLDIFGVDGVIREKKINEFADIFEMTSHLDEKVNSYSHGMKQKISLIASLAHDPKVFILDEPMTGLDPESTFNLKKIMQKMAEEGKVVFFSSHVLDVVEKLCTKVGIIDNGKLIAEYDVNELKDNDKSLEDTFLKLTSEAK